MYNHQLPALWALSLSWWPVELWQRWSVSVTNIKANLHRHDTDCMDCFIVSGVAVWIESARQPDRCVLCLVCVGVCRAAQCDRRTHSDAERTCPAVNSHRHTRQDKTAAPACRPPPPRRRQLRLAARPPTRSDVLRHEKCKHVVKCCILLNLNFFTKRQATTLIIRLTVQTLPDGLKTQFTPPDTTQTAQSCRVWRAVWIGH